MGARSRRVCALKSPPSLWQECPPKVGGDTRNLPLESPASCRGPNDQDREKAQRRRQFPFSPRRRGEGARRADEGLRGIETIRTSNRRTFRSDRRKAPHPALRATFSPPPRGEGRVVAAEQFPEFRHATIGRTPPRLREASEATTDFPRTLLPLWGRAAMGGGSTPTQLGECPPPQPSPTKGEGARNGTFRRILAPVSLPTASRERAGEGEGACEKWRTINRSCCFNSPSPSLSPEDGLPASPIWRSRKKCVFSLAGAQSGLQNRCRPALAERPLRGGGASQSLEESRFPRCARDDIGVASPSRAEMRERGGLSRREERINAIRAVLAPMGLAR